MSIKPLLKRKQINYRLFLSIICLFILPPYSFCQEIIEEKLLEEQAESSEQSELFEIIADLRNNPIDINTADLDELKIVPGLTPGLQVEIINYRIKNGPFSATEDLLAVPGMDQEIWNNIREFLTVTRTQAAGLRRSSYEWRSRASHRMDLPQGFKDGTYESSSQKLYHRLQFKLNGKLRGGMLLEKDAGEKRWDDLRLYYLSLNFSKIFSLLFGNYQLEFGQGLVLWGPYGFSKGAETVYPIKKRRRGIRGYLTVDENSAFFGGAASWKLGHFQLISFASQINRDATATSETEVSGFFTTGFHRNETEKSKKDVITETVFGGNLRYQISSGLSVSATYYVSTFNKKINSPDFSRNRFDFRGKENAVGGFDWDWTIKNFTFFGEAAQSQNGGQAVIIGSTVSYASIQLALLFREYGKRFQNFHSFAFGESSGNSQNERGFYTGINYKLTRNTKIAAYYDLFSHPWRTYFEPLPIEGKEFFSEIEQRITPDIQLTLRFRKKYGQETEPINDAMGRTKEEFVEKRRSQWRFQFDYRLSPQVWLRSRLEAVRYSLHNYTSKQISPKEDGLLLYQDFRIKPKSNFQLNARLMFFHTDSYDSRIFEFENDLPGVITNQALWGRGRRWYLLIKYRPIKISEISLKYSETYRDDVNSIGTGADQIAGNLDRRLGIQIEIKL